MRDAVVVGAGPAGSVTALLLARAGHDVLILDRSHFPRPKPCGDCLSAGVTALLDRLALLPAVTTLPHARLSGWRIVAPGGADFTAAFAAAPAPDAPLFAIAIERALLDAALLDAAIAAGASFLPGVRVSDLIRDGAGHVRGVRAGRVSYAARLVIGADGLRSVVARRLGAVTRAPRLRKLSLTVHASAASSPRPVWTGEMHCQDGTCVGIAPLRGDGSVRNVTVVADADRFGRHVAADASGFIRAALAGVHSALLPADAAVTTPVLASGPFDRPVRTVAFDGAALVGDAAGYFDPFTGQGVYRALRGAELLAAAADAALRRNDCSARGLAPYARSLRRELRGTLLVQHGIEAVLARPRLADHAIARIRGAPRFAAALIGVTGDMLPPLRLLSPFTLLGTPARRRAGGPT